MTSPPLPSADLLRVTLDRLEAFAAHTGTVALHDPIYFLLTEPSAAHLAALRQALVRHAAHPLVPRLRADFAPWLEEASAIPATLEAVLSAEGAWDPSLRSPPEEVRWRLQRAREVRAVLEARIHILERQTDSHLRTANAMAAVAAMVSVLALLGWLAALGVWRIPWLEPPPAPEALRPPTSRPTAPLPPGEDGP